MRSKQLSILLLFIICTTLNSCKDGDKDGLKAFNIGTAAYYPSFLFVNEKSSPIEDKTIALDFNDDAKEKNSKAIIEFINYETKKLVSMDEYYICADGKELKKPEIEINASQKEIKLAIGCKPGMESGEKNLAFRIKAGHELDYVNDIETPGSSDAEVMRINFDYVVHWNPLAIGLLWLTVIIILALVIWFLFAKPSLYPAIKLGMLTIKDPYFKGIRPKGAKMIIFTNKPQKQSFLNKLFTGRIIFELNDIWTNPLEMTAKKKGLRMRLGRTYLSSDSTLHPDGNDNVIENVETGDKIIITCN